MVPVVLDFLPYWGFTSRLLAVMVKPEESSSVVRSQGLLRISSSSPVGQKRNSEWRATGPGVIVIMSLAGLSR